MVTFTSYDDVPANTSKEDIIRKYDTVIKGYRSNKTLSIEYRQEQLRNMYYAVQDNTDLLKEAVFRDFSRPHDETQILELHSLFTDLDNIITSLPKWAKDESVWGGVKNALSRPVIRKQPRGTALIISPWNYPYFLAVNSIAAAIAAGNTVVWKPTEIALNASLALTKVLESALDPEIFQVVNGGVPESTALLELKFDIIMLTGSTGVGKIVAAAAAKHLTPTLLELGGKSPVFISKDADIAVSAKRVAWGKFVNAGQTCVAPDYVLVDAAVEQKFVAELKKAVQTIFPNLDKDDTNYCHIANERMYNRLQELVAKTSGKVELIHGTADEKSRFLPPTIVSGVTADDALMQDELFGPVLPVLTVQDVSTDGVQFAIDNHDTPLALYVFTKSKKIADSIIERIRSGGAIWNDTLLHVGVVQAPFGGVGNSGMGNYHGKAGFDTFSHQKTVLSQPFLSEALMSMRYPPYSPSRVKRIDRLSLPSPWYSRTGPVKRSLLRRLFFSKYWLVLLALIGLVLAA